MQPNKTHTFYEFFAGGGMARAGLGNSWDCLFANDIDEKKTASYIENWGKDHFLREDVANISTTMLPGEPDLAWASFPCQDLSLAGDGKGIHAKRSGTFWPFWRLMRQLRKEGRAPKLIVLENVFGALTSNKGRDFAAIGSALSGSNYQFGAVIMDAVHFVPQSRPRLFIIAVRSEIVIPGFLRLEEPFALWHPKAVQSAHDKLSQTAANKWVWWNIPLPGPRRHNFTDLIEENPLGVEWHNHSQTQNLISMMSDVNRRKLDAAKQAGRKVVGGVYRRTRDGVQRAEVRFDDVAGCLRTPLGGSSRQTIFVVNGNSVRSRLLSPREAVRLMGLPESYKIPKNYNATYHLAGDGVVVPVVRHLAATILEPIVTVHPQAGVRKELSNVGRSVSAVS